MVTVDDLIKILDAKENRYGATGKTRILNLSLNGNFAGSIESAKLDGYGDGLITDVTLEITSSKFATTNADRLRNMSDEEFADRLTATAKCDECFVIKEHEPYCLSASVCRQKHLEWLRSEANCAGKVVQDDGE